MEIFSLFGTIAVKYADAVNQIDTVIHSADTADGSLGDMEESAGEADEAVGSLGDSAEKADGKFSVWGATLANLAANAIQKVIDKCTELAKSVVTLGRDFTGTMSEVEAISGASAEDMQMLEETARHFGATTKFSANEAAEALKYMSMAGWDAEQSAAALGGVLDLAAASGEELGTTSDIVTDAMTAFGMSADTAGHFADVLAAASSNANTNVSMLGESFKYCAPVAGSMGASVEDVSVALGLMANAGIKGSAAGNSLKNALVNLVKPTKQQAAAMAQLGLLETEWVNKVDEEKVSKARDKVAKKTGDLEKKQIAYTQAVEKYGTESAQAKTKLIDLETAERNLISAQEELTTAQEGVTEAVKTGQSAFTNEDGSMKSLGEIMGVLRQTLGGLNVDLLDAEGNERDLDEVCADLSQTTEGLTQAQQLQNAAILFGKQNLSGMLAVINASEEDYKDLTEAIYGCNNAASEMAKTMNDNLQGDIASMNSAWEELGLKIYDSIERPLRVMVQAVTKKIVPALTAVLQGRDGAENILSSALQNMTVKLGIHIRNIAGQVTDAVSVIVSGILQSLPSLIPAVTGIGTTIAETLSGNIPVILEAVTDFIQKFAGKFGENLPVMIQTAVSLITALADGLLQALPELIAILPDAVQHIADGLLQSIDIIIEAGITLFSAVVNALPEIISNIVSVLPELITGIVSGLLSRVPDLIQAGITLFHALVDNLPEIISAITEVIPEIVTAVISAILENLPEIMSAITEAIPQIITAIVSVILENLPAILEAGFQLFSALIGALPEIIGTVAGAVPEIVEGIIGVLPEIAEKFSEFLQNIGNLAPILTGVVTAFLSFKAITGISGLIQNAGMIFLDLENIFYYFTDVILPAIPVILSKVSGAFTGLFSVIAANPVAAVIAVIAGLIVALVTLWNTNEDFRNAVIGIWESIQETLFNFFDSWVSGFETIKEFLSGIVSAVSEFFAGIWNFFVGYGESLYDWIQGIKDTVSNVLNTIVNAVQFGIMLIAGLLNAAFQIITLPFRFIWENCKDAVFSAWEWIQNAVETTVNAVSSVITEVFTAVHDFFVSIWNAVYDFISSVLNKIHDTVSKIFTAVRTTIETVFNAVSDFIIGIWNWYVDIITTALNTIWNIVVSVLTAVHDFFVNIWNQISNAVQTVMTAVRTIISNILNAVKTRFTEIWNGIVSFLTSMLDNIRNKVRTGFETVRNTISEKLTAAKNTVSNIFDNIRNAISSKIESAKNTVKNAVDKIKSFFNFSWSLPKLKLPHFNISGEFSLNPPSVPTFGIDWYAKGGIMTEPTVFGYNPSTQNLQVGGEAGAEAVAPIDTLLGYVRTAVQEENQALADKFDSVLILLNAFFPALLRAIPKEVVLDSGAVVGELAPELNAELANISNDDKRRYG